MVTAKEIMNTKIVTIREHMPIKEAIKMLIENNISGLPIVTPGKQLIGVVSEKDMFKVLYSDKVRFDGPVSEIMTRNVTTFNEDDNLALVAKSLIEHNFRRVPIVANGKLTGIVSRRDVIKYMLELKEKELENNKVKARVQPQEKVNAAPATLENLKDVLEKEVGSDKAREILSKLQ